MLQRMNALIRSIRDAIAKNLPDNVAGEIVEPAVHGVIYKIFARHTTREIFSTKRSDIRQAIESRRSEHDS